MKRILLVQPWIHDFAAYDFWIKPLGLLYLASVLRANGFDVSLIDCLDPYHPSIASDFRVPPTRHSSERGKLPRETILKPECLAFVPRRYNRYGITPQALRAALRTPARPDLVLVTSMMTYWYPGVWETMKILREELPGTPIVLGGNYVTLCPDHSKGSGADVLISGSGILPILKTLRQVFAVTLSFLPSSDNLDSLPYPAFDLYPIVRQVPILTSKGCPFRCSYCAAHLLSKEFERRDPFKVADEIEHWYHRLGIRHFSFYDDALLIKPDALIVPLLRELIRRGIACSFHCPNGLHLREVTAECASLMRRSGFETIRFGFETSDAARQRLTGGKTTNDEFLRAVSYLKGAGYRSEEIGVYLLCGLPGQSPEEIEESIRYVREKGARPLLAEYSPIPGTELWEASVRASTFPIEREPLFHNNTLLPCRDVRLSDMRFSELKRLARQPLP